MNRWMMGTLVAAGLTAGTTEAADRYVGFVEGFSGAARIAVIAEGNQWLVYVCGDADRINEAASRWWKGTLQDGRFAGEDDGVRLSAAANGEEVAGTIVTRDGKSYRFAARRVLPGARAGAYRAVVNGKAGEHVLSWIVDSDGLLMGCNKGNGKRVALKPSKLPPAKPKPIVRRKPKAEADAEADEAEKPARKAVKTPPKETEDAEEEDAEPAATADEEGDGEKVVGEKVVSATKPPKGRPAKKVDADGERDGEAESENPAKKKPADDEDG
jgi:hypothetical protein